MNDNIPKWLKDLYAQGKGRDATQLSLLEGYYKQTEVIKADNYDRKHFEQVATDAKTLGEVRDARFEDDPTWADLIQDEFLALYKPVPENRKDQEMKPTHRINHAALTKAQGSKEWETLRTYTELDQWTSAMATVEFSDTLGEIVDEMKELQEAQQEMMDKDQDMSDALDKAHEGYGENDDPDDLIDDLEKAMQDYQDADQGVQDAIAQNGNQLRQAGRQAAQQARESAEQADEALTAFGTDSGELQRMPAEKRFQLAARIANNQILRELAEKIGRMVRFAMGEQARKIVHGRDEVHEIELGNDLGLVLPSELSYLADPETEVIFFKKYADNELLQYQLRGTDNVARGAMIVMIDSSGSMGGHRETWAKAVGIALLNIAQKQGRDFYGIIFSSAHDPLMEFYWPKGVAPIEEVLDFAEFSYMGGTDFELPIGRGIEVLDAQFATETAQKGDLVMITDGESAVSSDWTDRYFNAKKELAFRMYACLIGFNSQTLDLLADTTYKITDLARGQDAKEMFGFV
jgi:uncharacterized protein with von Willebrand factor type A (vWA) domain